MKRDRPKRYAFCQEWVCCELRDADILWPALDVLSVDGKLSDCRIIAPSDVEGHLMDKR